MQHHLVKQQPNTTGALWGGKKEQIAAGTKEQGQGSRGHLPMARNITRLRARQPEGPGRAGSGAAVGLGKVFVALNVGSAAGGTAPGAVVLGWQQRMWLPDSAARCSQQG